MCPTETLASRCVIDDCGRVFVGQLTWENAQGDTTFNSNSPLIKRLALHHLSMHQKGDGGHILHVLFQTREEAKAACLNDKNPKGGALQAYYDAFPNVFGHLVVSQQRNVVGMIKDSDTSNTV